MDQHHLGLLLRWVLKVITTAAPHTTTSCAAAHHGFVALIIVVLKGDDVDLLLVLWSGPEPLRAAGVETCGGPVDELLLIGSEGDVSSRSLGSCFLASSSSSSSLLVLLSRTCSSEFGRWRGGRAGGGGGGGRGGGSGWRRGCSRCRAVAVVAVAVAAVVHVSNLGADGHEFRVVLCEDPTWSLVGRVGSQLHLATLDSNLQREREREEKIIAGILQKLQRQRSGKSRVRELTSEELCCLVLAENW